MVINRLRLKSNAGSVAFFDVLTQWKIYFNFVQFFQVEISSAWEFVISSVDNFQWYGFQHTYSNFHTITLTMRISPKEVLKNVKKIWHAVRIRNIGLFFLNGNGYTFLIIWKALVPVAFSETGNCWFADNILFIFIFIFCQLTIDQCRVYHHLLQHLVQLSLLQHNQNYWFFFNCLYMINDKQLSQIFSL